VSYEAECMCRAEAIAHARWRPHEFRELQARRGYQPQIKGHAYSMVEMSELFGGKILKAIYTLFYAVALGASLVGYATVFSTAMSSFVGIPFIGGGNTCSIGEKINDSPPGCRHLYYLYTFVYAVIVIPLSTYGIKEQIAFQVTMTAMRCVLVLVMTTSVLYASFFNPGIFDQAPQLQRLSSTSGAQITGDLFNWRGMAEVLPASIFSLTLNSYLPIIVGDMTNKHALGAVMGAGMSITCIFYLLVGITTAYYFGAAVSGSCNINWQFFVGSGGSVQDRPLWATCVSTFVVLFPSLDVVSIYPLNVINITKYLMAIIYHDNVDKVSFSHPTFRSD